jgi:hypothetical protein
MKHLLRFILGMMSLASIAIIFQNCAAPLDEERDVTSVAANAPFAYEAKLDHIAYMSCTGVSSSAGSPVFTFRAGAYEPNSGLRLSENFKYATRNLLTGDKVRVLQESELNSGLKLNLALRRFDQYQTVLTPFISGFTPGELSGSTVATKLANATNTNYINNFSTTLRFEESLYLTNASPTNQDSIKNGSLMLALTYNNLAGSNGYAQGPTLNSNTSIYGSGFTTTFDNRYISSMSEKSLLDGSPITTWDCPTTWRFMIIRSSDLGTTGAICENTAYNPNLQNAEPIPSSAAQQEMYSAIRNILPANKWSVNLNRRCIVIQDAAASCYPSGTAINYTLVNSTAANAPHYLSICKRR